MILKILKLEEMVALYIKILKKTITDTELELFKYNLDISCCVPDVIFFKLNGEAKKILGKEEWSKLYSPDIERKFHNGPIIMQNQSLCDSSFFIYELYTMLRFYKNEFVFLTENYARIYNFIDQGCFGNGETYE